MQAMKVAKNIMASKFFNKPFYAHVYVTDRCNLKCKMCSIYKRKTSELTLAQLTDVADKLKQTGVQNIVITGGEPMLRPDIYDIIKMFIAKGFNVRLQTNATLLNQSKLVKLYETGLQDITISLDTFNPKLFDKICGGKNLLNKVFTNLLFASRVFKGITIANIVVSKLNYKELPQMIMKLDAIGVYASLVPVHMATDQHNIAFSKELCPGKRDIENLPVIYNRIINMKKRGYKIISSTKYLRDTLKIIADKNAKWQCKAGQMFFVVYPDGKISCCDNFASNFNYNDLGTELFKDFSKRIANNCGGCNYGCWKEAHNIVNHLPSQIEFVQAYLDRDVK